MRKKNKETAEGVRAREIQDWFSRAVVFEGKPYTVDFEQACAIVDVSKNALVVARAGSGKTRTIVAKIVYLIAKCGIKPEEILTFVFNANAAAEVNARLARIKVEGKTVVEPGTKIASTFHAFARRLVYNVCGEGRECGQILTDQEFMIKMILGQMGAKKKAIQELYKMMTSFVDRAQQEYLGREVELVRQVQVAIARANNKRLETLLRAGFLCYQKYHQALVERTMPMFQDYGTDFNLLIFRASELIREGRPEVVELLKDKKYILVDEYQDFSRLFLSLVEAIRGVCTEARLFAVGDDWQAINRFAGSDVKYFKDFLEFFPEESRVMGISTNYRCDFEIVGYARRFMRRAMKESGDFRAFSRRAGKVIKVKAKREKERYLEVVTKLVKENLNAEEILILHRNNETGISEMSLTDFSKALGGWLIEDGVMTAEEYWRKVRVMTMHKSKGLEAEVVIILEADAGVIPAARHQDAELFEVFGETEEIVLDDQKRLFYVAMTRAKRKLYIIYGLEEGSFVKILGRGVEKWEEN